MRRVAYALLFNLALTALLGCRKSTQLSGSMEPTIKRGEKVTVNYLAYATADPHRWDAVAMTPPATVVSGKEMWLTRIIALPGEVISLTSTGIVVNGTLMSMPPALS